MGPRWVPRHRDQKRTGAATASWDVANNDTNGPPLPADLVLSPLDATVLAPTLSVGGGTFTYDGQSHAATATALASDGTTPVAGTFSYTYYAGDSASGPGSSDAPTQAGDYTVVAHFTSNDPNYASADSSPLTFNIAKAHLTIKVTSTSKTYGQTFDDASYVGAITGIQNSDAITASYSSLGDTATADVAQYAVAAALSDGGSGKLTTDYVVDSVLTNVGTLSVNQATTHTSLDISPSLLINSQPVTFTATVAPQYAGLPSGTVQFLIDGNDTGLSAQLSNGVATVKNVRLGAGPHNITASYKGDTNFRTSGVTKTTTVVSPATLSGTVLGDKNNNGRFDSGESGIANVNVTLTGTNDLGQSVTLSLLTDAAGTYNFPGLRPGMYTITETQPAGYLDGRDTVGTVGGTPDGTATNDQFSQVVLNWNNNAVNYNFGEVPLSTTSQHSLISSNFNGTAIAAGNTVWFNSVFTASGLSATQPVTIRFVDQEVEFTANGTAYDLLVPDSVVTFSPATMKATTTFDTSTQTWVTNLPASGLSGQDFLSGVGFATPVGGLPGGIKSVTWEGDFLTDTPGVGIKWKWAAAVYDNTKAPTPFPSGFSVDYGAIAVKPVDDTKASAYQNSDHAGTPENYKPYVIGGADGGGGANYTGGYSGSASVTAPLVIPNLGVLDPTALYDSAPWWVKKPKK